MELKELFEMQKKLDEHIIKEKGLEGQDLLPQKILALQVELGELAQNWRGFKFWSEDQEPRGQMKIECPKCHGEGTYPTLGPNLGFTEADCEECDENYEITINPLLEEYVDCLHFFLSIANTLELPESQLNTYEEVLDGSTTRAFTEMLYHVGLIELETNIDKKIYNFRAAFFIFLNMADQRFNFRWNEIVQAYIDKNKVNHQRQENGY